MKANWSLVLNVVLLLGVFYSIVRLVRMRKKTSSSFEHNIPSIGSAKDTGADDIIAVRKVDELNEVDINPVQESSQNVSSTTNKPPKITAQVDVNHSSGLEPLMMFLLAKEGQQLAGYELLQAVLAEGLRFGEGDLFHRHQYSNGQGTIMCSLAAATDKGTFDLQNMGSFSVRGLCLYMHLSGNSTIDEERFEIMHDTAKALSDDLDTYLLDANKQPLSESSINQYYKKINHDVEEVV
ncbi:MAG: cell division protein ZipA C-terminal FtsZ-binding domain-containing protein [Legionellaceae bacterium]|nr:cell division protein ZipA C-terminal FtsZ-binding domain-containing protein [Legionellaceae bacterium]